MAKYEVCPRCEGEGTTVHPGLSVWTESDRYENPEGFENMMAGNYNVPCPECGGKRVVTTEEHKEYLDKLEDERTRLMECGIYAGSRDFYTW